MSHVQCPKCQKSIRLREKLYGRKVRCKCGSLLRMPKAEDLPNTGGNPPPPTKVSSAPSAPIRFQCPKCFQSLQVEGKLAGQVSRCTCGTKIRVPEAPPAPEFTGIVNDMPISQDFLNAQSLGTDMHTGLPTGVSNVAPRYRAPKKKSERKVIRHAPTRERDDDEGFGFPGMGWVIWIFFILVFNLLSYIFEWPYYVY